MSEMTRLLPVKWNSFTRHSLSHLPDYFLKHGRYNVSNELAEERHHRVLKNLTRNTRNSMESLKKHLVLKLAAYEFMQDPNVCPDPPLGTVANPRAAYVVNDHSIGDVIPIGEQVDESLNSDDFQQLKECFAVEYASFRMLLRAYDLYVDEIQKKNKRHGRIKQVSPSMKKWIPSEELGLSEKQHSMKLIRPRIRVLHLQIH